MAAYNEDASSSKARLGGIADATVDFKFVERQPGAKAPEGTAAKTVFRTRLVAQNADALLFARAVVQPKSISIATLKNGASRAVAEYTDKGQATLLRIVAKHGIVHAEAARLAYEALKRGDPPEAFREEVEKALAATAETRVATTEVAIKRKKDAPPPADGEPTSKTVETIVPMEDEIARIADAIAEKRGWLSSFVEGGAAVKDATESDDGKRKSGSVIVSTRKMPRGLAVAHALHRAIGAGCTKSKRARIAFATKKSLKTLREKIGGTVETFDFGDIVA